MLASPGFSKWWNFRFRIHLPHLSTSVGMNLDQYCWWKKSKQPPGMVLDNPVNNGIKYYQHLPTSTGEFTGFQPSTVGSPRVEVEHHQSTGWLNKCFLSRLHMLGALYSGPKSCPSWYISKNITSYYIKDKTNISIYIQASKQTSIHTTNTYTYIYIL